jgi:DNA-binding CsgD family transcriptional regulator
LTLELTHSIYAAAVEPAAWKTVAESLVKEFGAEHAVISADDRLESHAPFVSTSGLDDKETQRFLSPHAFELGKELYSRIPRARTVLTQQILSDDDASRSEYYNEIIIPNRGFHGVNYLGAGPNALSVFICRKRPRGAYDDADARRLAALIPHLSTALSLRTLSQAARGWSEDVSRLLDTVHGATILIDCDGRPCAISEKAWSLLRQKGGLSLTSAGLAGPSAANTEQLRNALAEVTHRGCAERRLLFPRGPGEQPLFLRIVGFRRLGNNWPGEANPSAALIIQIPAAPFKLDRAHGQALWGLTAREADIAEYIARGTGPLPQIADLLGIGVGTARAHLKAVFEKTGATTQAMLAAILRDNAPPSA